MAFLIPLKIIIPVGLVIIILIVVLWYLYKKNKKIYSKIVSEKTRFHRYKKGIENLREIPGKPEEDFKILDKYVRSFFKEYLNLDNTMTYLELTEYFKKQNQETKAKLSKLMSDIKYKGIKTSENINQAITTFEKIIEEI